jgi:peptidoglycan/LPS O-acetylase OafA/YrhL
MRKRLMGKRLTSTSPASKKGGMSRKYVLIVAWLLLAFIVFATLSPIHLRPRTGQPNPERFAAFLLMGAAFAFAMPRRVGLLAVCIVACAFGLEAAQLLVPTRDAHVSDALVKACGGLVGVAIVALADAKLVRRRSTR